MEYSAFLDSKARISEPIGFESSALNDRLFEFQADITRWAVRLGRAAIFADCGLGKTLMQLAWADQMRRHNGGNVIILTPLAVAKQTTEEAEKFGIDGVHVAKTEADIQPGISVTNYERLHHFCPDDFGAVVLDESSILKNFSGTMRQRITEFALKLPYRLACTATPAPNDYMEFGTHSEFLSVMPRTEMLSNFFVHDSGHTQNWRLKGHAQDQFWRWMASWAVGLRMPEDLGYENNGFVLPDLRLHEVTVESGTLSGWLWPIEAQTIQQRRQARRESMPARVAACAEIANAHDRPFLAWCDLNAESGALAKAINGAVEVRGSHDPDYKADMMHQFACGDIRCLVTKPSIAGHGMNLQICHDVAFVGLSDSYEQFYQAVRRCWRYGQKHAVDCHIITSEAECAVLANIKRKESDAIRMYDNVVKHMAVHSDVHRPHRDVTPYQPDQAMEVPTWLTASPC